MEFWRIAWNMKLVTEEQLREVVICEKNPFGCITKTEFNFITGIEFDNILDDSSSITIKDIKEESEINPT